MSIYVVGSINMDLVIHAPFMPDNGVTITGSNFLKNPGGKGANQAVACAKMDVETYMVGSLGNAFKDDLINTLKGYNVNTEHIEIHSSVSSGIAVIVIVDGDNRIILDKGANELVTKENIKKSLDGAKKGDYLICQLEIPQEMIKYAFELGKEKGMITVLNPAPAANLINGILPLIDFFIPNQSECEFYTGVYPKDEKTQKEAFKKLKSLGIKNLIITLGLDGSCALTDEEFIHVPARKVNAIDTTAAGDTYIGALVSELSKGNNLKDAMTFASIASSITVTRAGAQVAIPTIDEVLKIIEK